MSDDNLPVKAEPVDPTLDEYLRGDEGIIDAINAARPPGSKLKPIPKGYRFKKTDRESVSAAIHAAFQLIGGLPRFVEWADRNPKDFYVGAYLKALPSNTETPVGNFSFEFKTAIPETPQDRLTIKDSGEVVDADMDDIPE